MFKRIAIAAAIVTGLTAAPAPAQEARTALIIGNAKYSFSPLVNPTNDANDMAEALRGAGFEVILKTDASQAVMKDAIRSFGSTLRTKGGVGLLFFAGHGVQVKGENYILPLGERPGSEASLRSGAVTAAEAVDVMSAARNSLNVVILDACRDNPLTDVPGASRGLSRMDSSSSLFMSFSTSPGSVALDGSGRNSPYTKHLKTALGSADLSLEDTFKRTLKGVYQETNGKQQPWISSSFFGDFVFRPAGRAALTPAPETSLAQAGLLSPQRAPGGAATPRLALGGLYRVLGTNPNGSKYAGMATLTPAGDQYAFTWWIARQVFSGVGQFAGKMMVVEWGDKTPVIYSVLPDKNLSGEWADGSATDHLTLYASAAGGDVAAPQGQYAALGRNPNGTTYQGRVSVTRLGNRFRFDWRVGSSSYYGTGTLDGNVMVVEWGAGSPVVYALAADGSMKGLWANGRGEEILTPAR